MNSKIKNNQEPKTLHRAPLINPTGRLNVKFIGMKGSLFRDFYYYALRVTWPTFLFMSVLAYLAINTCFATLYYLNGDAILNADPDSYIDAFIFSFQTSTTIGYGYLLPKSGYGHTVVMFDVFSGLLFVAVLTGLVFARFSRPSARVVFSENMLISKHKDQEILLFRVANGRRSYIVNAEVDITLVMKEEDESSLLDWRFHDLVLVRDHTPVFGMTWSIMHVIDDASPLFGLSAERMAELEIDLVVSIVGVEDVFAQTVHIRHSYSDSHILFNKKFVDAVTETKKGGRVIDFTRFNDVIDV